MGKLVSFALAANLAAAVLSMSAGPGDAGSNHYGGFGGRNFDFDFGLAFGSNYPYQPFYTPRYRYRPYYAPRTALGGNASWCAQRYRSYRASDNTYQPYDGPRRQCRSPYQG